jgi:hypothetical protein
MNTSSPQAHSDICTIRLLYVFHLQKNTEKPMKKIVTFALLASALHAAHWYSPKI